MPEEKDIHPILRSYIPLVKALAETLGPDYEVVLQSTKDPENSVVAIENGYVTGRKEGAPLTDFALYILKKAISRDFNYVANYLTKTQSGEKLRSTTIFIRDENQDIIGFLCLNFNMSKALIMNDIIAPLLNVHELRGAFESKSEIFPSHIEELIEESLQRVRQRFSKPCYLMSRTEKVEVIKYLDDEGFFLLKGSIETLAEEMGNTKYTIYSYLRDVRQTEESKS